MRGAIKIHWPKFSSQLQPTYIEKAIIIVVECCSILAAASSYEF